jgi:para-nitrobenzyl esterase
MNTFHFPFTIAAFCLSLVFFGCSTEVITLDSGQISGYRYGDEGALEMFQGIPYAAPPIGELRWRAPQPVTPWEGVLRCNVYGPACPQLVGLQRTLVGGTTSEDCLSLNVWRPGTRNSGPLPVMVWIHGGSFQNGAGSMYDASSLAADRVIVVTINYRLGALGFLSHPALSAEDPDQVSGNYGLLDQIAALEWVQRNIAAFGGDPDNVTIFGESAGSMSVACLLASPLAEGLFHRAIMQSGIPWRWHELRDDPSGQETAEEQGLAVAEMFGITGTGPEAAAALRSIDAEVLANVDFERAPDCMLGYTPVIDGIVLTEQPLLLLRAGEFNRVPVMVGSNADEGTLFLLDAEWLPRSTPEVYIGIVEQVFGDRADEVLEMYPALPGQIREQLNRLITDYVMLTPSRMAARAVSQELPDVYYYYFSKPPSSILGDWLGAFHSAEIFYIFGNLMGRSAWTPADRQLSRAMQSYWINFAESGNPNGDGNPEWPRYDLDTDQHLELAAPIVSGAGLHWDRVAFFESFLLECLTS